MSDGNPSQNGHNFGTSAGTFGGIAENKYVVAAAMAAIVLAGSALLYGKRMRVAHSDFPHAVPESEHAATRLIDQGGPDTRTAQDHIRLRVRHDDQLFGDDSVGPSGSSTSCSNLATRAQESDSSKDKAARSKDRRRRGKDPLREVLKSGKKLKSFNVATLPSSSALDLGTPAESSPRSTGVQTDDEFKPSDSAVTLASESATLISPTFLSNQRQTSSRSTGKRASRGETSSTSGSNSTSSLSTSTTLTPTPTSSTRLLKRALSPNSNYDLTHGDAVRTSRRGSITISEDDATRSSGMISAGHSRVTSEVLQSGETESLGSSASSSYLENLEGPEKGFADGVDRKTQPIAVSEGQMERPYLDESDAGVRPKHLHHLRPPEEGDIVSSDDDEDEDHHSGSTGARVRRLSGSGSVSLSVSNSRSHSHSPSPLRQSHTPSGSRDQSSSRAHPRRTGLRATSSSIGSEEVGDEEEEERSYIEDEDSRVLTGRTVISHAETKRQDVEHEISGADESGEYADRGRRTSRRVVVAGLGEAELQGEDMEAISRKVLGSVRSEEPIEESTRSLEEDQRLEGMNGSLGIIVVEPQNGSTRISQSGVVSAQVEGGPDSLLLPTFAASTSTSTQSSNNYREVHSDSSNVAMSSAHPEQSSRAKKRAKKAAVASGQTTTITQASSTTARKVPPGASGWDWEGTGSSTLSTPATDKSRTPKDHPDSRTSNGSFNGAVPTGKPARNNRPQDFIDQDPKEGDHSTPALTHSAGSHRKLSYGSESIRPSKRGGHRSTTPGIPSRGKNGTPPPLSPLHHRPSSPGDGLLAVSEQTQLASLRGALEAARQREEKHKAEMEQVVKEMETLKWESAGLRRGEGELHAHVHHLTRQVQGYESFFATMGPSVQVYTQQPHVPHIPQNVQPQEPNQESRPVDSKPSGPYGQDILSSPSAHDKVSVSSEVSSDLVDENSQSISAPAPCEAGQLDAQDTLLPSFESKDPKVKTSTQETDAQLPQPSLMKSLRLPIPSLPPFPINPSSPPGASSLPNFSPMSPSFYHYPIPPTPFTPLGHPPHPAMMQQLQWMQTSWTSAHHHQPHQFGQGSVSQSTIHQPMFSPVMMPMPPYPPQSPHQSGTFQNSALHSSNSGGATSPSHLNFSMHSPHSVNGPSAPSSAPGTNSAGSVSPDLAGSSLALNGNTLRPMKNRMRSQRNNAELSDINEARLAFGHGGSDGDDEDLGGSGGNVYSGLLADAILRRPGSIRALSSESLKKRAVDEESAPLHRRGITESVEQLTEFTFPSISDMSSNFYRNSPRTESSISSSLSSSPPSSTATVPDPVADSKTEEEKSHLPAILNKHEAAGSTLPDPPPAEPINFDTSSFDVTPRKEIAHLSTNPEPHI